MVGDCEGWWRIVGVVDIKMMKYNTIQNEYYYSNPVEFRGHNGDRIVESDVRRRQSDDIAW